jgi:inosose dehydratase
MSDWVHERSALFGIQWYATPDGWLDRTQGPPLAQQLETCRAHGFRGFRIDVPEDTPVRDYVTLLSDHGLAPAPAYLPVPLDDDGRCADGVLDRARRAAAVHAQAGLTGMFLGCGMARDAPRVAEQPARGFDFSQQRLDRVVEAVAAVASVMCAEGVRPALHPHVGTWVETEAETRHVLDSVDEGELAFGPDTGHLAWAGADLATLFADYRNRINHVHVKDISLAAASRGHAESLSYQQTVLAGVWREPGRGDVDLETVLDVLGPGFEGWLVCEVDRPSLRSAEESISACGRWFRGDGRRARP